jgi:hypothetical protein
MHTMFKSFLTTTLVVLMIGLFVLSVTCAVLAYRIWNRSAVRIHQGATVSRTVRPPLTPADKDSIYALVSTSIGSGLAGIGMFVALECRGKKRC